MDWKFLEFWKKLLKQRFSSSREENNALYLLPMAQGKLKVKSKVPDSVAKKKKQQNSSKTSKVVKRGKKFRGPHMCTAIATTIKLSRAVNVLSLFCQPLSYVQWYAKRRGQVLKGPHKHRIIFPAWPWGATSHNLRVLLFAKPCRYTGCHHSPKSHPWCGHHHHPGLEGRRASIKARNPLW